MEIDQTIYKKDTKGKMRYLRVTCFLGTLSQTSGIVGTISPVTHSKFCEGKNTGRANETSHSEQAQKEAIALLKDKMTKGYFATADEAEAGDVILPMLAKDYKKEHHKIDWGKDDVYVQPKFDGMRCLAFVKADGDVKLMSRSGKVIENMEHIERELSAIRQDIILDGELYVHGENFQQNMRYIKKYRKGLTERVAYHVYDTVDGFSFSGRHQTVSDLLNKMRFSSIKHVETLQVFSEAEVRTYHARFIGEYEGTMVRIAKSSYTIAGRSSDLLKYKDFHDLALEIVDIVPNESRPEQGTAVLGFAGNTFKAGMKYSHADRAEMLSNKHNYIGKTAEIRFFEYSETGIPRFPVMVGIRLDK